jgi:hypothetical protein
MDPSPDSERRLFMAAGLGTQKEANFLEGAAERLAEVNPLKPSIGR